MEHATRLFFLSLLVPVAEAQASTSDSVTVGFASLIAIIVLLAGCCCMAGVGSYFCFCVAWRRLSDLPKDGFATKAPLTQDGEAAAPA